MNTVLHVPLNKILKSKAEFIAKEKGYSSLQEVLRVFIVQFTNGEIKPMFVNPDRTIQLSSIQEKYLIEREAEVQKAISKNKIYKITDVDTMMEILET